MMYQNKFVVAIKHDGKVLREIGDVVKLPFGSEFTVLVKNLNSRRAKFKLHIDGTDVLDGTEIIVDGNKETELKRFIRAGNMNEGNAFKFIERTQKIEDGPRGIKADDGIVRVEWCFEQEVPEVKTTYHRDIWWNDYYRNQYPGYYRNMIGGPSLGSLNAVAQNAVSAKSADAKDVSAIRSAAASLGDIGGSLSGASYSASATAETYVPKIEQVEESLAGITVPGSKVEQKFTAVYGFNPEAQTHVIVLRLVGKTANDVEVTAPVTVKSKQKCDTCGHLNKATSKFCSECGTALDLL